MQRLRGNENTEYENKKTLNTKRKQYRNKKGVSITTLTRNKPVEQDYTNEEYAFKKLL